MATKVSLSPDLLNDVRVITDHLQDLNDTISAIITRVEFAGAGARDGQPTGGALVWNADFLDWDLEVDA